jgi:SMI1/KNR4 family protein SUKH-1
LLGVTNGGEGDLGVEPGWFVPWRAEDVLLNNSEYQIAEYAPGLFGFGSNGGGECLAFDLRDAGTRRIVMVPFIGMDLQEIVVIAENFDQFVLLVSMPMAGGIC